MSHRYGEAPTLIDHFALYEWKEFMHYMYLPIRMKGDPTIRIPEALHFVHPIVDKIARLADAFCTEPEIPYIYVTARRGYATPDNPLNRPGWHCDGFGTNDVNFVWWDTCSTRFAIQEFTEIDASHALSMQNFEEQIDPNKVVTLGDHILWLLTPYVVHNTPIIPPPGTVRSFLKISVSQHRYNLEGNSHNYLFKYAWPMYPRDAARNDPHHPELDFVKDGES